MSEIKILTGILVMLKGAVSSLTQYIGEIETRTVSTDGKVTYPIPGGGGVTEETSPGVHLPPDQAPNRSLPGTQPIVNNDPAIPPGVNTPCPEVPPPADTKPPKKNVLEQTVDYINEKFQHDPLGVYIRDYILANTENTKDIRATIKAFAEHTAAQTGLEYSPKSNNKDMTKRIMAMRAEAQISETAVPDLTAAAGAAITHQPQTQPNTSATTPPPTGVTTPPPVANEPVSPHDKLMGLISKYLKAYEGTDNHVAAQQWIQAILVNPGGAPAEDCAVTNVPEANIPAVEAQVQEQLTQLGL